MTTKDEVEKADFRMKSEFHGILIHDDKDREQGQVLIFVKEQDGGLKGE